MNEQSKQKLIKEFEKLPKENREAIALVNWEQKTKEIGEICLLTEEEISSLQIEVGLLLAGITTEAELETQISEIVMGTEKEKNLMRKLIEDIFIPIATKIDAKTNKQTTEKDYPEISSLDPRFESMPDKVKEAINLSGWKDNLYKISTDNKLNIEQMGILEDITVRTMKNEISPDKYKEEISLKMSIDKEKAENIAKEVNTKIFQEIRNIMRENENLKKSSSIPQETIQGTIENFEEAVPVPPYAKKEIHDTSSNNVVESAPSIAPKKETVQDEMENELHNTLTDQLKSVSLGTPGSSDFSIPKVDISKQTTPTALSSAPAKPHDPYREII